MILDVHNYTKSFLAWQILFGNESEHVFPSGIPMQSKFQLPYIVKPLLEKRQERRSLTREPVIKMKTGLCIKISSAWGILNLRHNAMSFPTQTDYILLFSTSLLAKGEISGLVTMLSFIAAYCGVLL